MFRYQAENHARKEPGKYRRWIKVLGLSILIAMATPLSVATTALAESPWPQGKEIISFEPLAGGIAIMANTGTDRADLALPSTVRAVIQLTDADKTVFAEAPASAQAEQPAALEQPAAEPETSAEAAAFIQQRPESAQGYTAPSNEAELRQSNQTVVYTLGAGETCRVYGALGNSGPQWFACDAGGGIFGVVRELPLVWSCESYDAAAAGDYVFVASANGYTFINGAPQIRVSLTSERTVALQSFTYDPVEVKVERGTAAEDLPFPKSLSAKTEDGSAVEVAVTWENVYEGKTEGVDRWECADSYASGGVYGYGPWTFAAVLPRGYSYSGAMPTATVSYPDCMEIESFLGRCSDGFLMRISIPKGGQAVPSDSMVTGAIMADGGYKNVPITLSGSCSFAQAGTYRVDVSSGKGYIFTGKAYVEVVVTDNE